jgi:hypothetical protein
MKKIFLFLVLSLSSQFVLAMGIEEEHFLVCESDFNKGEVGINLVVGSGSNGLETYADVYSVAARDNYLTGNRNVGVDTIFSGTAVAKSDFSWIDVKNENGERNSYFSCKELGTFSFGTWAKFFKTYGRL